MPPMVRFLPIAAVPRTPDRRVPGAAPRSARHDTLPAHGHRTAPDSGQSRQSGRPTGRSGAVAFELRVTLLGPMAFGSVLAADDDLLTAALDCGARWRGRGPRSGYQQRERPMGA
jgi:hypothetical protein